MVRGSWNKNHFQFHFHGPMKSHSLLIIRMSILTLCDAGKNRFQSVCKFLNRHMISSFFVSNPISECYVLCKIHISVWIVKSTWIYHLKSSNVYPPTRWYQKQQRQTYLRNVGLVRRVHERRCIVVHVRNAHDNWNVPLASWGSDHARDLHSGKHATMERRKSRGKMHVLQSFIAKRRHSGRA